MRRYWLSWVQPSEDERPLTYPPNALIRGWWCSGFTDDGATLCAVVDAESEREAKRAVREDWPEAKDWRFIEKVADDFVPSSRFPAEEWMVPRLAFLAGTCR